MRARTLPRTPSMSACGNHRSLLSDDSAGTPKRLTATTGPERRSETNWESSREVDCVPPWATKSDRPSGSPDLERQALGQPTGSARGSRLTRLTHPQLGTLAVN